MASLYLYLEKVEWCKSWIEGGEIDPPRLASSYLSMERSGTRTPDEAKHVVVRGGNPQWLIDFFGFQGNMHHVVAERNHSPTGPMPDVYIERYEREDARILCFSRHFHVLVGLRLKKSACVRIPDIEALKREFDRQFGVESKSGPCTYTTGNDSNHFLKSVDDAWQDEFRLVWPASVVPPNPLIIPAGTARMHASWRKRRPLEK